MDNIEYAFYALQADLALSKKLGSEFEDFFTEVGAILWDSDFEARRPQGRIGDKKCDGYRVSTKTVFQCYAPRGMTPRALLKKMKADFSGAVKHFGDDLQEWVLVHNDAEGLPTEAHEALIEIRKANLHLTVEQWGPKQLQNKIMSLDVAGLRSLFPTAPNASELRRVAFPEIDSLISILNDRSAEVSGVVPIPPSPEKLSWNELPMHIGTLLKEAEISTATFQEYFFKDFSVDAGNIVSGRFIREYVKRRDADQSPSQIFWGLVEFAGGLDCEPTRQAAVIGLLSYLFHTCDIFEDKPSRSTA